MVAPALQTDQEEVCSLVTQEHLVGLCTHVLIQKSAVASKASHIMTCASIYLSFFGLRETSVLISRQ